MKKILSIILCLCSILSLTFSLAACGGDNDKPKYDKNQKVNAGDVPWEAKMGVNDYGDRALIVEFTNNSEYTITELSLEFSMKTNLKEDELNAFYSYLAEEYDLSDDEVAELKERDLTMSAWVYLSEDEYLEKGKSIEDSLCYGYKYIYTMDYYDLFRPDMYKIVYIDESGEECTTYYDYINKSYSNK